MINDISVLYLSKYADANETDGFDNIAEENYAKYHINFRNSLNKIFQNLHTTHCIDDLIENHANYDYVISLYNQYPIRNSEIFISSLCEYYKIPYLGATPNIRALAEDKHLAKCLASSLQIPTSPWVIISSKEQIPNEIIFNGPYFIKPRFAASSKHIDESCICNSWIKAVEKITYFLDNDIAVIVEKFIDGTFYSVPAFSSEEVNVSLPYILKTNHLGSIVTHNQKRGAESGMTREFASLSELSVTIQQYSKTMYNYCHPLDYARFDFLVENNTNSIYFLEFNICCNMSPKSGFVQTCLHNNLAKDYEDLIEKIMYSSLKRQNLIST